MKDLDNKEISIGDRVAVSVGGRYHDFYIGKVVRFTAKKVGVETEHSSRSWNEKPRLIDPTSCVVLQGELK